VLAMAAVIIWEMTDKTRWSTCGACLPPANSVRHDCAGAGVCRGFLGIKHIAAIGCKPRWVHRTGGWNAVAPDRDPAGADAPFVQVKVLNAHKSTGVCGGWPFLAMA